MERRILLTIGCVCFTALTIALVAIGLQPPASGYELSVYQSVPLIVWISLVINTAGGIGIAVYQAFKKHPDNYWLLGLCAILASNIVVLSIPIMREYFLYASADTIAHTQWTSDIVTSSHFLSTNRYPIIHTLSAQLALVCNLPPYIVIEILPILFSILFACSGYLLAKTVLHEQAQAILVSICAATLFFGYYHVAAYPQGLSMMALPLIFYLYFNRNTEPSLSFRALFVVLLIFLPFFHPATAVVLIVCLGGAEVAKGIWSLRNKTSPKQTPKLAFEPTLIAWITFFTWISAFGLFGAAIRTTLQWLEGEIAHVPRVAEVQNMFANQGLGPIQQIELALKLYGDNLMYLALSSIALLFIIRGFLTRAENVKELFLLSILFLISGPVWILIFVTTLQVTMGRLLGSNAMMWAAPVLAGFALYKLFERAKRLRVVVVTAALFCTSVIAIFGVYHSPFTLQISWQITHADGAGADWFFTHYDGQMPYGTMGVPPAYALSKAKIPEHFNYTQANTLGTSFERDTYLLLTDRFRMANVHPILSQAMISDARLVTPGFTATDFEQLDRDHSAEKIYSNGEFDIYLIRSQP